MPRLSSHAAARWQERCPGLDPETEYAGARRAGKAVRRRIREGCPGHSKLMAGRTYRGYWYMVSRNRVVFVIADREDVVVTVWKLPQPGALA